VSQEEEPGSWKGGDLARNFKTPLSELVQKESGGKKGTKSCGA